MNNMVSRLRLLSKQIIQEQKILFTFHKIRFMGHLILGSLVQLHPIFKQLYSPDNFPYKFVLH
jgi:hypothetical protein